MTLVDVMRKNIIYLSSSSSNFILSWFIYMCHGIHEMIVTNYDGTINILQKATET